MINITKDKKATTKVLSPQLVPPFMAAKRRRKSLLLLHVIH